MACDNFKIENHLIRPFVNSYFKGISFPYSSSCLEMVNVDNIEETRANKEFSARCRPGQILVVRN
jgi:hypothetical protein